MHLYLDIDGVLIRDGKPTPQCFVFLRWAVDVHQPFWLTTRDAHGQHDGILRAFRVALGVPALPAEVEATLRAVRPTKWRGNKVSGIDLASDFVWIDDDPLLAEIDALRGLGLLDRLLIVDGDDGLLRAAEAIKRGVALPRYRTRRNPDGHDNWILKISFRAHGVAVM
jgi:hypothetical protein